MKKNQIVQAQHSMTRTLIFYSLSLGLLFLLSTKTALADGGCEANFHSDGTQQSGIRISTWQKFPNMDTHRAIAQIQKLAAQDGFHIGEATYGPSEANLDMLPPSRAFPVRVGASSKTGNITLLVLIPAGRSVELDGMRSSMCGMLAKVDMGSAGNPQATQAADDSRSALPNTQKVVRPTATFDKAAAQQAIEPGSSTIKGTACSLRSDANQDSAIWKTGHVIILANMRKVYLYPDTPYLEQAVELMHKASKGRYSVDFSREAQSVRLEGSTNEDGQFQFSKLKPGKYFITSTLSASVHGSETVYDGTTDDGPFLTAHYHTQYNNFNYDDILEKYVEVKRDGDVVDDVSVKPTGDGHLGCRSALLRKVRSDPGSAR